MEERRIAEIRTSVDIDHRPIIEGHAAVFNQPSLEIFRDSPGWREIIRPGAFTEALKSSADVVALIDHLSDKVIGRVSSRTLSMEEDEVGLKVRIFPLDTSYARDLLTNIRGGNISQMSFGFSVGQQEMDHTNKFRNIVKIQKLYDVSPVTQPAYTQTDVNLRTVNLRGLLAVELEVDPEKLKAESLARSEIRRKKISLIEESLSKRRIVYELRY